MQKETKFSKPSTQLLGIATDAKTSKGLKLGYMTGILYLAPHTEAGRGNVCSSASEGCIAACLFHSGRGKMDSVVSARVNKTHRFFDNPKGFVETLASDIAALEKSALKQGLKPAVRLNGTSDLPWHRLGGEIRKSLMDRFPNVAFYDYTKVYSKAVEWAEGKLPANYHVTFSRSECNESEVDKVLAAGGNVAVVFNRRKGEALPTHYKGVPVVDGDISDVRFDDPKGVIVGLRFKGSKAEMQAATGGFVVAA